jgi:HlyD family secretion protein
MSKPTCWRKCAHPVRRWLHAACNWMLGAAVLGGSAWGLSYALVVSPITPVTGTVTRATLSILVTARGELESGRTTDVCCEIEGCQNRIITALPEGTMVRQGQVVVTFDTDRLQHHLECQQLKLAAATEQARAARYDLDAEKIRSAGDLDRGETGSLLADLDARKFVEGDYKVQVEGSQGEIELARSDLQEKTERLTSCRKRYRQGFGTLDELRAEEAQYRQKAALLQKMETRLSVLEKYTRMKSEMQLRAEASDARRELELTRRRGTLAVDGAQTQYESADAVARLEKEALERLRQQLDHCIVRAPHEGMVVYCRSPLSDSPIAPGATICFQQPLFRLPDLTRMQVKLDIDEAKIGKVRVGQKATIRVEASPDSLLRGTIARVAPLADATHGGEGGAREYTTIVQIDHLPRDAELRPGMTAEVTILVEEVADALLAPVEAVTESQGRHIAYVIGPGGVVEHREIEVAETNEKWVRILSGLQEGEVVALDARSRLAAEARVKDEPVNR